MLVQSSPGRNTVDGKSGRFGAFGWCCGSRQMPSLCRTNAPPAPSKLLVEEVARVELDCRLGGMQLQQATRSVVVQPGTGRAAEIEDPVVVVATLPLLPIGSGVATHQR